MKAKIDIEKIKVAVFVSGDSINWGITHLTANYWNTVQMDLYNLTGRQQRVVANRTTIDLINLITTGLDFNATPQGAKYWDGVIENIRSLPRSAKKNGI